MRKILAVGAVLASFGAAGAWILTAPRPFDEAVFDGITANAAAGEAVFWAAGCASCHNVEGGDPLVLAGGQAFATQFGTFHAPNISPDPEHGIGAWGLPDFARAIQDGVSPDGAHYYPALPYTAYAKMTAQDVADLKAFMDTLPADATPSKPHDIAFPFNIRRSLGGWKLLFGTQPFVVTGDLTAEQKRGRYIAEALAHCGECHTPRNFLGGLDRSKWLAGAANPDGKGRTPNIAGIAWSDDELRTYFTSGFTPDFDVVGGHMAHVVENMGKLSASDRDSLIAYLRLVPALPN